MQKGLFSFFLYISTDSKQNEPPFPQDLLFFNGILLTDSISDSRTSLSSNHREEEEKMTKSQHKKDMRWSPSGKGQYNRDQS